MRVAEACEEIAIALAVVDTEGVRAVGDRVAHIGLEPRETLLVRCQLVRLQVNQPDRHGRRNPTSMWL
jgi:hypothetical protein